MRRLVLILLLLANALFASAQQRPYINYTTHSGLPQIQVMAVHQDQEGYIWAGTKSGLVKFNGETFEHFLPKKRIYEIISDEKHRVYVKTYNELYRYDGKNMKLMASFKYQSALCLAKDSYWLSTPDGLIHYKDSVELDRFNCEKDLGGSLNSFAWDHKHEKLWVGIKDQKKIVAIKNGKVEDMYAETDAEDMAVMSLGGKEFAIVEYYGEDRTFSDPYARQEYFSIFRSKNKVDSIGVKQLPLQHYIYFNDYKYYHIDSASNTASKIKLDFIKGPYPVIIDRDRNIWSGSDNGLYQIFNGPVKNYPRSFMNDLWTLIKGKDNEFYGAVYKEALYHYDLESLKKSEIKAPGLYDRKETDYYYGSSMDGKGNLYFPTHYGMVKYNYREAKKFDTGISLMSRYDSISNRIVMGQINGLAFLGEDEKVEYLIDTTQQFVNVHPSALEFDKHGDLWIGSKHGLSKWERKTNWFTAVDSCPGKPVTSIHRDYRNNMWLGGKNGLWLYDFERKTCKRVDDGIISSNITGIISPGPNLLVVGTSLEVYVMDLRHFYREGKIRMKLFNFRNGFLSEEVCQNGFFLDGDQLYVPSTTCTSVIDLSKIHFETEFYSVQVTGVNDKGILRSNSENNPIMKMERGCNELDFSFESVGFGLPTKPLFRYKLEGVDKEWSKWTTKTYANYRNLASGKYTFKVMARAGGNPDAQTQKYDEQMVRLSLPFYKEPRFYQHTLFGFVGLVLILGFFVLSRYRYKLRMLDRERKIKFLEIATLQAQLNPHFVFNILSSVQNMISLHEKEKAIEYLIKFSRLIRAYMEASIKSSKVLLGSSVNGEISVKEEIDLLKMYIELEQVKHKSKRFDFKIELESDDMLNKTIPPMILQPLVENSIKHGLEPREEMGLLEIFFREEEEGVQCLIKDNGIGREKSELMKRDSIKLYQSRGLDLINKKIDILNDLDYHIRIEYKDSDGGTEVLVDFLN
jgi:two-component sensor histidine kinase